MLIPLLTATLLSTPPDSSSTTRVQSDSLSRRNCLFNGDLSGSVISERYGAYDASGSLVLKSMAEYRRRTISREGTREYYAITQLGYASLFDSIWVKQSDLLRIQFRSMRRSGKLSRSWTVMAGTQWMESRRQPGRTGFTGGFLNPLRVEAGTGIELRFWKDSRVLLQPAGLTLQFMPKTLRRTGDTDKPFLETSRDLLIARYGLSMQLSIDEQYADGRLVWRNQSRVFLNALSATQVGVEVLNRFALRFLRVMQLRIETQLNYAPERSLRLEYRQEVLLGVFYEQRR